MASRFDQAINELETATQKLEKARGRLKPSRIERQAKALEEEANIIATSFCGSWFGYHSRIYYKDFKIPPPGAHFSREWGFAYDPILGGTKGEWMEYQF